MAEQITKSRLRRSLTKRDKYGAELRPGNVCVWGSKAGAILCLYIGDTRGNNSTGTYGRFYTQTGIRSIAYKSVVLAYDSIGSRIVNHGATKELMRNYYG